MSWHASHTEISSRVPEQRILYGDLSSGKPPWTKDEWDSELAVVIALCTSSSLRYC